MTLPSAERCQEIVLRFLKGEFELLSEGAVIWLAATLPLPSLTNAAALVTPPQLVEIRNWLNSNGRSRFQLKVNGVTAAAARVAVEAASHIELESGDVYANRYHILFAVVDDRITHMREYCDTRLIEELFGRGRHLITLPKGR